MIRYAQTAHAFGKSKVATRDQTHRELVDRSLQFHERSQDFIGTHDESFSVTMRVNDSDRSPFKIESSNPAQAPTSFAEIVSDNFSVLQ